MTYMWKISPEDLDNDISKQSSSLHEYLEKISFEEINDMKNRVNFCLAHIKIISKHEYSESTEYQINFLKKINSLLDNEIHKRKQKI